MNTATPRKIQTAFRLDADLVSRLKLKAKQEKIAPDEDGLVWPKVKFPIEPNPKWKDLTMDIHITKEDLERFISPCIPNARISRMPGGVTELPLERLSAA